MPNGDEYAAWFNFKTRQFEYGGLPITDAEALNFIPQIPAARGLYECHRLLGKSIGDAMIEVLSACVGERKQP